MKKRERARRRDVVLPEDACSSCGATMKPRVGDLTYPVNEETILVPRIAHLHCAACGEEVLDVSSARKLREGAFAIYRRRHRLLSGRHIRDLRNRLGLTQVELARLLRLGPNTLSRWESGANVQSGAMDVLLRLLRDLPDALPYLRGQAA